MQARSAPKVEAPAVSVVGATRTHLTSFPILRFAACVLAVSVFRHFCVATTTSVLLERSNTKTREEERKGKPPQSDARRVLDVCLLRAVCGSSSHAITRSPDHLITRLLHAACGTAADAPLYLYKPAPHAGTRTVGIGTGAGCCRHHAHAQPPHRCDALLAFATCLWSCLMRCC
jgi:hypothetical protein